jgi:hypothetical protein
MWLPDYEAVVARRNLVASFECLSAYILLLQLDVLLELFGIRPDRDH